MVLAKEHNREDKNKSFKLDWSIKNYEERVQYLIDSGLIENNAGGWIKKTGVPNYKIETITSYLLRSGDIGSERDGEYPHYRDDSKLMTKLVNLRRREEYEHAPQIILDDGNIVHRIVVNDDNRRPPSNSDYEHYIEDDYVNRLFRRSNMSLKTVRSIIKNGMQNINMLDDENVVEHIISVYEMMIDSCRNEIDVDVIMLLSQGMGDKDIADRLKVTKQAVSQRIQRIFFRCMGKKR